MSDYFDVLIIGSGGAGLSAALEAHHTGANVAIVSKTYPTHSQTCQAQGGINAAINGKEASIQAHIQDTIKGSHALYNPKSIETFCHEAPKSIQWLDQLGVPFSRNAHNQIAQRKFGAASEIRTCYSSDYTGLKILHTLYDQCIKEEISFFNEYQLLNLIKEKNQIIGITALNIHTTQVVSFYAKTVILATGGYANLYHNATTNSNSTTGDGIIAAYKAGCALSNLEMIQFHPTAMIESNILISESARGEGGYLVNEKEERFIDELKPRDEVARAIYSKIEAGEKVYLDLRHIDKDKLLSFMPQEYRLAKEYLDIELDKELLPINPAAHYCMGGIKTNVSCETNLKNLYAVGECAEIGLHGANRLGGNSLQEIITFGRIAGKEAAQKATQEIYQPQSNSRQEQKDKEWIEALFKNSVTNSFYEDKRALSKTFIRHVGLFRSAKSLNKAQQTIAQLQRKDTGITDTSRIFNKNLVEYLEYKNLLILAELVTHSALQREESRGAHYRTDFEEEKEHFIKNSIIQSNNETFHFHFEELICK